MKLFVKPFAFSIMLAGLVGLGILSAQGATVPGAEGLVPVHSWNLDELYLRPNADLASYRQVAIDPVQVSFRKDWNRDFVDPHASIRRLSAEDARRIAEDAGANMSRALIDAFRARGYEVVSAPGPGVLRLTPSVTDLYVNAAEELATGGTTKSFTKDAGEATLVLEVRDGASGALLGRVVDRRTARETKGTQRSDLRRTTEVSNNFWFDQSFRQWAGACIKEFEATKKS